MIQICICPHCLKEFPSPSKLGTHIKTHTIGAGSSFKLELLENIKTEEPEVGEELSLPEVRERGVALGEKMIQICICPHCQKEFPSPSTLGTHIKTHTREKPYRCKGCSQTFSRLGELVQHTKSKAHTKMENSFRCKFCSKIVSGNHNKCQCPKCKSQMRQSSVPNHIRTFHPPPVSYPPTFTLTEHIQIHSFDGSKRA